MRRLAPVLLALTPALALAGPPYLTDDPDPVSYQTFEAIPNYNLDRSTGGSTLSGPGLDFNYGIHPDMHLNLGPGLTRQQPVEGPSAYGIGDTRVALKWRFVHESDNMPEIAIYPAVELPTGSARRGLGNGQVWYQFPIWLEKNFGSWSSYGGGGWTLNRAPGQRDYFYGGWQLQRNLASGAFLGGELFSQGASADGVAGWTALNLAGGYNLAKHALLIVSGGHSIAGASHLFAYVGVDFTWGP